VEKVLRILILEDSSTDASLMEFEPEEAQTPFVSKKVTHRDDYMRELQEFSPDLILSDYNLPQYNGAMALADAKFRRPRTPFILVTGAIDENLAKTIICQGVTGFVTKNHLDRLAPAVRRAV